MSLLDYFRKKNTASIAKERLQIIVAHERAKRGGGIDLPGLQQKLIEVIADHLHIERNIVKVELEHDESRSILELNVTLPDKTAMRELLH